MKKHSFFCKISFDKIILCCYNEEIKKVVDFATYYGDYLNFESRYLFSNKEFINEFIIFINNFEKKIGSFVHEIYLIFEDSFIQSKGINVFIENLDETRINYKDFQKLKNKAIDYFKLSIHQDEVITSVFPFEMDIDDIKINFGKKAKGKKLSGNFYIISILKIILNKIDFNFSKLKIHIKDIFSSEMLYSFYVKSYLKEEGAVLNKSLFIKINTNETIFYFNDDKNNIVYKNFIKKGIIDILKISSKELKIETDIILECFKKLGSLNEKDVEDYFVLEKEGFEIKVEISKIAEVLYKNIIQIFFDIKKKTEEQKFQINNIYLHYFEFNHVFLEKICFDVFKKQVFLRTVEANYKSNIVNNSRIIDIIKDDYNFDDIILAIDFYKKIINQNLNENSEIFENKITCFLKNFFY